MVVKTKIHAEDGVRKKGFAFSSRTMALRNKYYNTMHNWIPYLRVYDQSYFIDWVAYRGWLSVLNIERLRWDWVGMQNVNKDRITILTISPKDSLRIVRIPRILILKFEWAAGYIGISSDITFNHIITLPSHTTSTLPPSTIRNKYPRSLGSTPLHPIIHMTNIDDGGTWVALWIQNIINSEHVDILLISNNKNHNKYLSR